MAAKEEENEGEKGSIEKDRKDEADAGGIALYQPDESSLVCERD